MCAYTRARVHGLFLLAGGFLHVRAWGYGMWAPSTKITDFRPLEITIFDFCNHNVIDSETFVIRIPVQVCPHSHFQGDDCLWSRGQINITACNSKYFFFKATTTRLCAIGASDTSLEPAYVSVHRHESGLTIPVFEATKHLQFFFGAHDHVHHYTRPSKIEYNTELCITHAHTKNRFWWRRVQWSKFPQAAWRSFWSRTMCPWYHNRHKFGDRHIW